MPTTTQGDGILDLVEMEQLELDMIDGVQKRLLATGNHEAELIRLASFRDEVVAGDHVETLMAFKRAGCSGVLTYHAAHAARLLNA